MNGGFHDTYCAQRIASHPISIKSELDYNRLTEDYLCPK